MVQTGTSVWITDYDNLVCLLDVIVSHLFLTLSNICGVLNTKCLTFGPH